MGLVNFLGDDIAGFCFQAILYVSKGFYTFKYFSKKEPENFLDGSNEIPIRLQTENRELEIDSRYLSEQNSNDEEFYKLFN